MYNSYLQDELGKEKSWTITKEGFVKEEMWEMNTEDLKPNREKDVNVLPFHPRPVRYQPEQSTEVRNSFNYSFIYHVNLIYVRLLVKREISMMYIWQTTKKLPERTETLMGGLEEKDTEIGWDEILHTQRDRNGMTREKLLWTTVEEKKRYSESGLREKPIEEQGSGYLMPG